MKNKANFRQSADFFVASQQTDAAEARRIQRAAKNKELVKIASGLYVPNGTDAEVEANVRRNWQKLAGILVPGAVLSHISAMQGGLTSDGVVTLSHPTRFNKKIELPGVSLVLLKGPTAQAGDLQIGTTGLAWASRPRSLLENLGPAAKNAPRRAGREKVEERLVEILNASGESALNQIRDDIRILAPMLEMESQAKRLQEMIGALLGTHAKAELRTRAGQLVAKGTPIDNERRARFQKLADYLRAATLPTIPDVAPSGSAKINFAFLESYFSNYVEGTKFSIEQAEDIVMRNKLVTSRPKDSHDILGVFNQAMRSPYRDTLPPAGEEFLEGLQARHAEMLKERPEAQPGEIKTDANFAGQTRFVDPGFVRGTFQECSKLALSIHEGMARAIYYAFPISEIHPFADGNGRLSRLLMNAELSRIGQSRIIIPTLYHPQYVDCARTLTRGNEPESFVRAISKMAVWCSQFDYAELATVIKQMKACNAMEESPVRFKLLNRDGSIAA